jgi:methylase of polypeptide subunit release factors
MFAVETYLAVRACVLVHLASASAMGNTPMAARDEILAVGGWATPRKIGVLSLPGTDRIQWALEILSTLPDFQLEAEIASGRKILSRFGSGPFFDVFQLDHSSLIPKELRHTTGTYYTPQWLARYVLKVSGYSSDVAGFHLLRIIDPTCGSGVFLMAAAEELRQAVVHGSMGTHQAIESVAKRLHGIDIDPLAAIQTAANLSLALIALSQLKHPEEDESSPSSSYELTNIECRDSLLDKPGDIQVDLVVGNPPWVNWEYLPPDYRTKHADLWPELGIFDLHGRDKAFSKEDVSALFFAATMDKYLTEGGKIAFLVPQSLLKAALNHRAFRKFSLRQGALGEVDIRVDRVQDFVAIRPFEGVANRTILIEATRGASTTYPVPYRRWTQIPLAHRGNLDAALNSADFVEEIAEPADSDQPTSHWTTGPERAIRALRQIRGRSAYRARTGVFTGGANGVFHLSVVGNDGSRVVVENITERAKRVVPSVRAELESAFIYPLLRGREVTRWRYEPTSFILLPHTAETKMEPISESALADQAPATLEYLEQFRSILAERAGFVGWERRVLETGFYACQRIGEYTFTPWKVVWRYIAPTFISAAIGPYASSDQFHGRPILPNEKLMSIACGSEEEAYYLCGLLSSSLAVAFVESRMVSTQIAPHLIQGLAVPVFDSSNSLHTRLSEVCKLGHEAARVGAPIDTFEDSVDALSAEIFGAPHESAQDLRFLLRSGSDSSED